MSEQHDLTQDIPEMTGEGLDLDTTWEHAEDVVFDEDPEAAMVAESEDALPPVRVRFTAPMVLRRDAGDTIDGALLNLSARGVAAIAPTEVSTGERVWLQFRLHLAEDPISLLCEVIWCAPQDGDGDWAYGLRFASITREEERRVRAVVAERSEGRAGEWPLPVMPPPTPASAKPTTSPWLSAAAGMAAGIGLALAVSVIPNASVTAGDARAQPPRPETAQTTVKPATTTAAVAEPAVGPASEVQAEPAAEPIAQPAPDPDPPAPVAAAEPPAPERDPDLLPRKQPVAEPDGDVLTPLGTSHGVELALLTDGSVADHVSFWLDDPRRLVVDVYGRKSGFSRRAYHIDHSLASQLRVGQHSGKVRFVIETAEDVARQVRTRAAGKALVVELRRK